MPTTPNRRNALLAAALLLLGSGAALRAADAPAVNTSLPVQPLFPAGSRVLFQGDSITDGNRGRNQDPNHILGHGYVFIIAAAQGAQYPERHLVFLNRGCSGNKVSDLQTRWPADTINLKPDVLSIAIGINDYCFGVPADKFAEQYDQLLAATVKALPKVRLVLCEPFGLPVGRFKANWTQVRADLQQRQAAVARLAAKYHAILVPFQQAFDEACRRAPADYWIWDGVHPTYSGHQVMAAAWARAVAAAPAK